MFGSLQKRSSRRPPDARGAVGAGGGDALAVGEEGHGAEFAGVAFVFAQFLAALRIPEAHEVDCVRIRTGNTPPVGDDALAVGRERGAPPSALDLLQLLAGLHVPDLDRAFGTQTRRQQARAVRREAHPGVVFAVPGPTADFLAGFEVPQADPIPSVRRREPGLGTVSEAHLVAAAEDG